MQIDRFGVMAVYGRPTLSHKELQNMTIAENVINAYLSRKASGDFGKWAQDNPKAAALLIDIEKQINATD